MAIIKLPENQPRSGIVVRRDGRVENGRQTIITLPESGAKSSSIIVRPADNRPPYKRYPGIIGALATAVVADIATTQKGEKQTVPDAIQNFVLGGVAKLQEAVGVKGRPVLPTYQNFEKVEQDVKQEAERIATTGPRTVILGYQGLNNEVAKRSEDMVEAVEVLSPSLGNHEPTAAEVDLAQKFTVDAYRGGPELAQSKLRKELEGRMGDVALTEIKNEFGEAYGEISRKVKRLRKARPGVIFSADKVSKWAFPGYIDQVAMAVDEKVKLRPDGKVDGAKGVSYAFTANGIQVTYYKSGEDDYTRKPMTEAKEVTIPWGVFAAKGAPVVQGTQYQMVVKPAPFVKVIESKVPVVLRNLINQTTQLDNKIGMIVFEPIQGDQTPGTVEYPPLIVRSPKDVVEKIESIRRTFNQIRETEAVANEVMSAREDRTPIMVRPSKVVEIAGRMWNTNKPFLVERMNTRLQQYQTEYLALKRKLDLSGSDMSAAEKQQITNKMHEVFQQGKALREEQLRVQSINI